MTQQLILKLTVLQYFTAPLGCQRGCVPLGLLLWGDLWPVFHCTEAELSACRGTLCHMNIGGGQSEPVVFVKVFHTRSLCKALLELLSLFGKPSSSQATHLWFVCVLGHGVGEVALGDTLTIHRRWVFWISHEVAFVAQGLKLTGQSHLKCSLVKTGVLGGCWGFMELPVWIGNHLLLGTGKK